MDVLIVFAVLWSIVMYAVNGVWFLDKLNGRKYGQYERRKPEERRDNIRHARALGASFAVAPLAFPFVAARIMVEQLDTAEVSVEQQDEKRRRDEGRA